MFQIEPDTFGNFLNAFYWATVSLATVGYGDITAVSAAGRLFTILSTFIGIVVIALPAGIVTAGYLEELRILREDGKEKNED
jgi:voltage-gated potassium channel